VTSEEYREASQEYLKEAQDALKEGNYYQASEKLWGTAAEMVKAVAESKGWSHNGHAQLFRVVRQLVEEMDDRELALLFRSANSLHINFYERWMTPEDVEEGAEDVNLLLQKLEGLIEVSV